MLPTPAPPAADSTQTSGAASASAVGGSSGLRAHKRQLQQWAAQHLSAAEALLQRQLEARAAALAAERAAAAARCRAHREKLQEALARLEGLLAATAAEEAQVEIQYARGMTGLKQEYARVLAGQRRQLELAAREALRGAVLHDMAAVAAVAAPPVEPLAVVTAGSGGGNTSGAIVASASAAGKVR